MDSERDEWIPFGTLTRAHGVRGEIRLKLHNPADAFPAQVEHLRVQPKGGQARELGIQRLRPTNDAVLLTLEGIDDRDKAASLRGAEVYVSRADLPALPEGEFYLFDLIGAQASDEKGSLLGKVQAVSDNGGQDLLVLNGTQGELLVPICEDTVRAFLKAERRVTLRIPEGLLG